MVSTSRLRAALVAVLGVAALAAALLVADVATVALPARHASAAAAPASYPAPSWWDGDCDTNHWTAQARSVGWTGAAAHRLGAVYLGIPACGPRTLDGAPDVWWKRSGWGELEWECVEYAQRFMIQVYGVTPYQANGVDVVNHYTSAQGGGLVKVSNGTVGKPPLPGDVVSFSSPTNQWGHVAVVATSSVDGNGNGSVKLVSQNDTPDGWRTLSVSNWRMAAFGSLTPYGWLHDPAGRGGGGALGDGQFIVNRGVVFRMAGGAPVFTTTWAPFGGPQPTTAVPDSVFDALPRYPKDGTFLRDPVSHAVYRVAGGAPVPISSCGGVVLQGCPGAVDVDPAAIAGAGPAAPWNHLRPSLPDGTMLRKVDGPDFGWIGVAVGGSLLHVLDCSPYAHGCDGWVDVDTAGYLAYLAAHPAPLDGTVAVARPSGAVWGWSGGTCRTVLPPAGGAAPPTIDDGAAVACAPRLVVAAASASLQVGIRSGAAITASGGSGSLAWSVQDGTLPPGLSLGPTTGVLRGAPTTAGTWRVTVLVSDRLAPGSATTGTVTITVAPGLGLQTTAVTDWVVGTSSDVSLGLTGATGATTMSVRSGQLPPGVRLTSDGHLVGRPTVVGEWQVGIHLQDSATPRPDRADAVVDVTVVPAAAIAHATGG